MTPRHIKLVSTVLLAISTSGAITACSSSGEKSAAQASTTTAATTDACGANAGKYPPKPTTDQLNGLLQKGLDPNVPSSEKTNLVQGAEGDPDIFNRMGEALRQANLAVTINGVTAFCDGTASADAVLELNGQSNPGQIPLVAEGDVWKLDKAWACGIIATLRQSSPICP